MLFHSQGFVLLFLPIAVAIYYALAKRQEAREWWLIAASLFFYGWWDVRFVPLLIGQTVVTWLLAELAGRKGWRWPLQFAIVANFAVLGLFKYLDFGATILAEVSGLQFAKASLVLPIGISFYTFELVSYLVDRLRGTAPHYNIRVFSLFIALFPHLIAGPIMRHNEIIPQFAYDPLRPGLYERIGRGLILFFIGFVEKFFIADRLAGLVDPVFTTATSATPAVSDAASGSIAFSAPDSVRLRRLFQHGDGHRLAAWADAAGQFQRAVSLNQSPGVLAALAHDAVALDQGLHLYPTRG